MTDFDMGKNVLTSQKSVKVLMGFLSYKEILILVKQFKDCVELQDFKEMF